MARSLCIPGVFLLFSALVLLVLTSISVPFLDGLDTARTHFNDQAHLPQAPDGGIMDSVRFGIWGYCTINQAGDKTCHRDRAYSFSIKSPGNGDTINISANWTRGLIVTPIAAAVTLLAFLFSLSSHLTVEIVASILSFLAALLTLIAFAIDIALFAFVKHEMDNLQIQAKTITAPGFWLTFASFILLLLGGCTVIFGHRRNRANAGNYQSYPMSSSRRGFWQRFRRS
ncbi:pali-domain-containing protein [Sistotremastrum niveocremeum HHB9708]|uniref:Pali-domain-containing protein n=2 Tax=Sistotremastraceae TaxID=3402574 RepID=A0A164WX01_9AGAM|nr:pali-domain-containing protein [Sistotremastrum niveocremeum HHB9708]KZT39779.1 pali-domain-containing protein [Sistotremastrum suecicum HHB10207 ss-3]